MSSQGKQGHSNGRILEAYRQLRVSYSELTQDIEIMSQPASNVDSVILSWCIESQRKHFPATLSQRDCFSSVFSDAAEEAMCVGQQLSRLISEKCTSKLQLTNTDISQQFKSQLRKKLQELKSEWKAEKKDSNELWKVNAKEIVVSVVAPQQFEGQEPQGQLGAERSCQAWLLALEAQSTDRKAGAAPWPSKDRLIGLRACSPDKCQAHLRSHGLGILP